MQFLSVIIPVYNVENYLRQCVDSVLNQHLDDYEIILVDDGSPDACPRICDEYASQYSFIHVIHKPNGGLSSARNIGLKAATGKYVMFVDSDDWLNPNVKLSDIERVVQQKPEIELFIMPSLHYVEGKGYYQRVEHNKLSSVRTDSVEHYYHDLLQNGNLEVSAFSKIIERSFLLEHGLQFREGITGEDNEWMIRVLRSLNSIYIIDVPMYIYRLNRPGSITHSIGKKNISDLLEIVKSSIAFYKATGTDSSIKQFEWCFCSYLWFCALGLSVDLSKQEFNELLSLFEETRFICKYSRSPKTRLAYIVSSLMGLTTAQRVFAMYIKEKNSRNLRKKRVANE